MSGCASSHMEQLIQNVLFKLQRPAFLLSPNPKTSSGLSRMLPCKRLLSIWMWLHSYGEGGDVGFVCSAPVIFLVFFMVPRYFFLMQGTLPILDVPGSCSGSLQGLSLSAGSFQGSFCEGCCVWSAGLRAGSWRKSSLCLGVEILEEK